MRTAIRLKLDCVRCVLEFCRRFPDPTPAGTTAIVRLQRLAAQVETLLGQQHAARQEAAASIKERDRIAGPMRERLAHLARLAGAVALHEGEKGLRLTIPAAATSQAGFLAGARGAVAIAAANEPLLLSYGMPPGMLGELSRELDRYEETVERRSNAEATVGAAGADIAALAGEALQIIRLLDALNHIRFATDRECLTQWEAARTIRWGRAGDQAPAAPPDAAVA
jgi:hypothetical protein